MDAIVALTMVTLMATAVTMAVRSTYLQDKAEAKRLASNAIADTYTLQERETNLKYLADELVEQGADPDTVKEYRTLLLSAKNKTRTVNSRIAFVNTSLKELDKGFFYWSQRDQHLIVFKEVSKLCKEANEEFDEAETVMQEARDGLTQTQTKKLSSPKEAKC